MFAVATTRKLALLPGTSLRHPPTSVQPTHDFQNMSPPTSIAWSSDNTSLFVTSASILTHLTASGELVKSVPLKDGAQNLLVKDKSTLLFSIPGTSKIHVVSLSHLEKPTQIIDTHKAPNKITSLTISNDNSLLASTCATGVHVHNLALNSHTVLRGIPPGTITCSAFHPHTRTRLLLGVGAQLVVCDTTRPSSPIKVVPIVSDGAKLGEIVSIACSPFSKTLVGIGMSEGWLGLVDLDKDKALFRVLPLHATLTTLVFAPSGAAMLAGTGDGRVLIVDLRGLDRIAGNIRIGEELGNSERIVAIAVQKKSQPGAEPAPKTTAVAPGNPATKKPESGRQVPAVDAKSSVPANRRSVPSSPVQARQTSGATGKPKSLPTRNVSGNVGDKVKSKDVGKEKVAVPPTKSQAVGPRERSEETERVKKPFSPVCDPLGNSVAHARRDYRDKREDSPQLENVRPPQEQEKKVAKAILDGYKVADVPPEKQGTISVADAPRMQYQTEDFPRARTRTRTRTISSASRDGTESVLSACTGRESARPNSRAGSATSAASGRPRFRGTEYESASASSRTGSSEQSASALPSASARLGGGKIETRVRQRLMVSRALGERESHGGRTPSPDLPFPSPLKGTETPPRKGRVERGALLDTPGVTIRMAGRARGMRGVPETCGSGGEEEKEEGEGEGEGEGEEKQLSVVLSPRRRPPTASAQSAAWATIPSPLLRGSPSPNPPLNVPPGASSSGSGPQEMMRYLLSDALYELQQNQREGILGLHLDLLRMGRGWTKELEGVRKELGELREENKLLREENGRLRRGY